MNTSLCPRLQKSIVFHPKFALPPLLFSWNGPPASIFAVPQSHHQGAREMKQFCPGMYHAGVAVKPPTLKGTTGRARVTTQRDPLHRVGHRPQFPAEALMVPWDPSPLAPLRLPTACESEWTPVLSCKCLRLFSNSTPSFLHGYIQVGTATEREIGCQFGVWRQGSVLVIDWSPRDCQN